MTPYTNPGPNCRTCPNCGPVWLPCVVNLLFADGVNTASEYPEVEITCPLCGGRMTNSNNGKEE
jgi:hypothetical protein